MRFSDTASLILISITAINAPAAPELSIRKSTSDALVLEWGGSGILERSGQLTGPWEPMPGAVSGWTTSATPTSSFFRLRSAFPLHVQMSGQGGGTVTSSPTGLGCTSDCQSLFEAGSTVTLNAVADQGSEFSGWTGDYVGTGSCVLTMDGPKAVTATFAPTQNTGGFVNGDFEQGPNVGWIQVPGPMIYTAEQLQLPVFSGQYAAWVGFDSDSRPSATIYQTVTLPNTFPLYLNFAIWLYSEELCDVPFFDTFGVYANGVAIEENPRVCQGNTGGDGWRTVSLDVSLLAGLELQIAFEISSVGTLASVALIDDVHFSSVQW